jgi:hypothetical protein
VPAKRDKSSKLKLNSRQHLDEERVKKKHGRERSPSSDNDECRIIGLKENSNKIVPNPDSPAYYFEDLLCNSGDECSDEATAPSPPPKEKLQPKKTSHEKQQTKELKIKLVIEDKKEEFKVKLISKAQQAKAKPELVRAPEKEPHAKLVIKAQHDETKANPLNAQEKASKKLARAQEELKTKAKLLLQAQQQEEAKANKLLKAREEEEAKAKKLDRAQQEAAKAKLVRDKEAKWNLRMIPKMKERVPIKEKTEDVSSKKNNKPKLNCPSDKESDMDDDCKKISVQILSRRHKYFQLHKKQPKDNQLGDDKITSSTDSKLKTHAKCEAPVKNKELAMKKKPLVKQPVVRKKQPEPETSDESEEKEPKPRRKYAIKRESQQHEQASSLNSISVYNL